MWSVGISVSPSAEAERLGYDERQINRMVIRIAQYFLDRDMRIIFGHDWREDGVMRAVADFAGVVATRDSLTEMPTARMLNVVAAKQGELSGAALEAERDSGGVLAVVAAGDKPIEVPEHVRSGKEELRRGASGPRAAQLTRVRHLLTMLLNPGCRVCLGGRTDKYQGDEPGVMEEARLALRYGKPLYLMGGFGGATRLFGEGTKRGGDRYWDAQNGLSREDKRELFETTDVERALGLISRGIAGCRERAGQYSS